MTLNKGEVKEILCFKLKLERDGIYSSDMHLNLARPFENITEDFLYVVKALVQYLICKYVYGNLNAKMKTRI